jgi:NitT/TauT family transport system substrate-binding protein
MSKLKLPVMGATAGVMALTLAACGSSSSGTTAGSGHADTASGSMPTVTLQMKWLPQGQFGGYIAAVEQGFYKDQGLNVKLINGSPEITAEDTVAEGTTDYSVAWPADALAAGEKINKIVDVAQFYQRPGLQEYALKSSGITSVKDFAGKKIGVNGAGNDVDVLAALSKAGMSPSKVTLVQQNGNVMGLLTGDLDAAQGASYNELGQLLMAKNPKTGKDYTLSDLNIFDWGKLGTGMLEDGLWANQSKLKSSRCTARRPRRL